jgi:hypothetical protein
VLRRDHGIAGGEEAMSRKGKQLNLPVRLYHVRVDGYCDFEYQAATPPQARWKAFRAAQEAGYFSSGFRSFLHVCGSVFEKRR